MTALDYLNSLIEGQKVSSIPVQISELQLLQAILENEEGLRKMQTEINSPLS
jgi:hypothetical protein